MHGEGFSLARAPRRERLLVGAVFAVCALALAVHFAATALYLMPLNPVKVAVAPLVDRYMLPWFAQRWELFAPDPRARSQFLLVACRVADPSGAVRETPWIDTTSRLYAQHDAHRLSAADRIARAELGVLRLALPHRDEVMEAIGKLPEGDPDVARALEDARMVQEVESAIGKKELARAASVECDRQYGVGVAREVRGRVLSIETPPFAARALPLEAGERVTYDFEWMPYERVSNY